jgi:hypothetical protein
MKKFSLIVSVQLFFSAVLFAQVGVNTDNSNPDPSAGLDVKFENKGFLPPRMTFEQRNAILVPAEGLIVFCTNCDVDGTAILSVYKGGKWRNVNMGCPAPATPDTSRLVPAATQITWKWNKVPIAIGYKWNTVNDVSSATEVGLDTTKTETGLTPVTDYTRYVWAYNDCGMSAPVVLTCQTLPLQFYLGLNYGGGIIFYIDGTGEHGLIAAPNDCGSVPWGCYGTGIGTSSAIGAGQANTMAIVNGCGQAGIAARLCDDLVVNGYDDWFLPSSDELHQLILQQDMVGGFIHDWYWSSTELDIWFAIYGVAFSGWQDYDIRPHNHSVRAIRAF